MPVMTKKSVATSHGLGTRAIHAGQQPDPSTGAIMTPIYATSTYVQESPGKHKGYEYSRTQNPTRMAYERCVADLEGGVAGFAFGSGLAAAATVLDLLDSGSHVIAMDDLYGGSYRLFERVRGRIGLQLRRSQRCRCLEGGIEAPYPNDLGRNPDQSDAEVG